ncbi:MAG: alpha/beta hydrolase [Anaerolineaceae bacterium]|nr:alpha/beta hydrolase [Anaerolineaceae bacterium]
MSEMDQGHGIPMADTSAYRHKHLDVSYAEISPAQKLDIYVPESGDAPFPVILAVHGGAFMMGDKGDVQVLPMLAGLKRGYAVVSINYRMSGEALFPALVHDIKAAVRWVRGKAARYGFDGGRIAAWGGSAGGYLSAMVGVTEGVAELEDLSLGHAEQSSRVQAVVDWFGPTDFLKMDEQVAVVTRGDSGPFPHNAADSPESLLLGAQITNIPEKVRAANPEMYVRADVPPFFIQHGTQDTTVPPLQSVNFAAKLAQVAGPERVRLELLEGAGHADAAFNKRENVKKVLDFLDEVMGQS